MSEPTKLPILDKVECPYDCGCSYLERTSELAPCPYDLEVRGDDTPCMHVLQFLPRRMRSGHLTMYIPNPGDWHLAYLESVNGRTLRAYWPVRIVREAPLNLVVVEVWTESEPRRICLTRLESGHSE